MKFSVLIPAHNEELLIGDCLRAITRARDEANADVEVIVCLNHCTDGTQAIAEQFGAKIVSEEARNLSMIRNRAAREATGDVIVTIDADSRMSPNMFREIERMLLTGRYIGGGCVIKPERYSLGILLSGLLILLMAMREGTGSAGLFWCYRKDFEAIGGFDENLLTVEDLFFAKKLKAYGATQGKAYGTIRKAFITTSCRKFDRFGDWYFVKNFSEVKKLFTGKNKELANKFYYEFKR